MSVPCVVGPPDLWFSEVPADVDRARALCAGCPMRRPCLAGALQRGEACGVWGGEMFAGGRPVPGPRRNGRPRKGAADVERVLQQQMTRRIDAVLASV